MTAAGETAVDWIAVDWGTTNLRLWALGPDGSVLAERTSGRGMGRLEPREYEAALLDLADPFLPPDRATPVIVCGMAGARQGWIEAPYRPVPCPPAGPGAVVAPTADPRLDVRILPGLCQSAPPDVMRGEETQIAGFIATRPDFDGVLCLPGTHSKWVRLRAGAVLAFRTAMTGEAFGLLAEASVLRHSVGPGWDAEGFRTALHETLARPETLLTALFAIRARGLLQGDAPAAARARLSGLLIGQELAAIRDLWQGFPVTVIGAPDLAGRYAAALAVAGAAAESCDAAGLALAGLATARAAMKGVRE